MIRRDDNDGFTLITQYDHAVLAGRIMECWGNEMFASPSPLHEVLFAVREHDCGWKDWDSAPKINPENGYPANFMEMESSDQTGIWRRSFASHGEGQPYASVLIALHFAGFNRKLLTRDPSDAYAKSLDLEISSFISEKLGVGVEDSKLSRVPRDVQINLRLLQVGDIISLALCHGWESMEISDVPVDYEGNTVRLALESGDGFKYSVSPYPFSGPRLELKVEARKLGRKSYSDDEDLRRSLGLSPRTTLDFTIIKG
jgi:hypothetical protein